jgi:hypothetical protein
VRCWSVRPGGQVDAAQGTLVGAWLGLVALCLVGAWLYIGALGITQYACVHLGVQVREERQGVM